MLNAPRAFCFYIEGLGTRPSALARYDRYVILVQRWSHNTICQGSDIGARGRHCDDETQFMAEDAERVSYPGVSAMRSRGPTTAVNKSCAPRAPPAARARPRAPRHSGRPRKLNYALRWSVDVNPFFSSRVFLLDAFQKL